MLDRLTARLQDPIIKDIRDDVDHDDILAALRDADTYTFEETPDATLTYVHDRTGRKVVYNQERGRFGVEPSESRLWQAASTITAPFTSLIYGRAARMRQDQFQEAFVYGIHDETKELVDNMLAMQARDSSLYHTRFGGSRYKGSGTTIVMEGELFDQNTPKIGEDEIGIVLKRDDDYLSAAELIADTCDLKRYYKYDPKTGDLMNADSSLSEPFMDEDTQ